MLQDEALHVAGSVRTALTAVGEAPGVYVAARLLPSVLFNKVVLAKVPVSVASLARAAAEPEVVTPFKSRFSVEEPPSVRLPCTASWS